MSFHTYVALVMVGTGFAVIFVLEQIRNLLRKINHQLGAILLDYGIRHSEELD